MGIDLLGRDSRPAMDLVFAVLGGWEWGSGASEGKGPRRRPRKRLDRRLEEVAEAVGGGYCRLQMPLRLAVAVRETVAGRWLLGALEGGAGGGGGLM